MLIRRVSSRNRPRLRLLFLDIATDDLKSRKASEKKIAKGPYVELFRKRLDLKMDQLQVEWAAQGCLPEPAGYNGIIIGGSSKDPVEGKEEGWMMKVYQFVQETVSKAVPLLGVCGGHQFIARALGAKVIYNPRGREFGTLPVILTAEGASDPLFTGVPDRFFAQLTHRCIVEEIQRDWKLLASSDMCEIQAVAINERTRIVQFHPEFSGNNMLALAKLSKKSLIDEGLTTSSQFQRFLSFIKEANQAARVLKNFLTHFVAPNAERTKRSTRRV
jgi:GMP synthase (glutamine-hydrolysing)